MKKTYSKPILKSTELLLPEQLLANSGTSTPQITIDGDNKVGVGTALSNQESEYDIWGNSGNSIW